MIKEEKIIEFAIKNTILMKKIIKILGDKGLPVINQLLNKNE